MGSYTVYVSTNGGPFGEWLTQTTNTSAVFAGTNGGNYRFHCLAADLVGNWETKVAVMEAETTVDLSAWVAPSITGEPRDIYVRPGEAAVFEVEAAGAPGPSYAWRRGGVPLTEDARISVVHRSVLTIGSVTLADEGVDSVLMTNTLDHVESRGATLHVVTATLTAYAVEPSGAFTLSLGDLMPGRVYRVYASTDLVNWSLVEELLDVEGTRVIRDEAADGAEHRFYVVREGAAGGP